MMKIEKEIKNTIYCGIFMAVCGVYNLLSSVINIPKNDFEFAVLCIVVVVGISLTIKTIYTSNKVERKDELIRYAEGKADQYGFNWAQSLFILSCGLCNFIEMAGIAKVNILYVGYICMTLYGFLIIIRNAYLLKQLHKDE